MLTLNLTGGGKQKFLTVKFIFTSQKLLFFPDSETQTNTELC